MSSVCEKLSSLIELLSRGSFEERSKWMSSSLGGHKNDLVLFLMKKIMSFENCDDQEFKLSLALLTLIVTLVVSEGSSDGKCVVYEHLVSVEGFWAYIENVLLFESKSIGVCSNCLALMEYSRKLSIGVCEGSDWPPRIFSTTHLQLALDQVLQTDSPRHLLVALSFLVDAYKIHPTRVVTMCNTNNKKSYFFSILQQVMFTFN